MCLTMKYIAVLDSDAQRFDRLIWMKGKYFGERKISNRKQNSR